MSIPIITAPDDARPLASTAAPSVRWAVAGLSLSMLLSSLGTSIANVALPTLAQELGASFQAVQWIVLAYLLAITTSIVGMGRLGDVYGRRRLLRAGLFLFTAASVVSGVAPALWLLIVARALQGLGAAAMMALTVAFVSELLPKNETGRAMGLLGATSAIGSALGPSLGGALIGWLGWRAIFLVNVPLGILALLLVHRCLPADHPAPKADRVGFDAVGTLLLALTLAAYALAMTIGRGDFGVINVALLVVAALGGGLFVLVQSRAVSPLIRLARFRDRALSTSLAASLLVSTVLMATLVVGPFYLSLGLGLDAGLVGVVMSVGPIVAALTGVPAGRAVDRLGARRVALAGLVGIAAGTFVLSVAPETLGILGYIGPIVVVTGGYALFQAANNTAIMSDVAPDQRGVVSGLLSLSRNLGLVTGASVMGAVFALASGTNDLATAAPEAIATGMRATFGVAAVLIVVAMAIAAGGRNRAALRVIPWMLALAAFSNVAAAQDASTAPLSDAEPAAESPAEEPEVAPVAAPLAGYDQGFVMRSADGIHSIRVAGLFQLQYAHHWMADSPESDNFFVNRARVGLTGTLFSRDLRYMLVAELGGGDPRLLFLNVDYTLVPGWLTIRVGRFKRPFSRAFITMAGQMSMIDRPMTIGPDAFGDGIDVGVMLHNGSSGPFEYAVGVFTGSASGGAPDRVDPLVALRAGYNVGDLNGYSESDLEGGAPRFGVAAAGLVDFDADGDHDSFSSALVDVMLKAYGFSLSSALHVGARQDGSAWADQRFDAIGHYTQMGYVIAGCVEPVVRYAFSMPADGAGDQHDLAAGLNLYFHGHAFKLQSVVTVRLLEGRDEPDVRFQSQLTLSL